MNDGVNTSRCRGHGCMHFSWMCKKTVPDDFGATSNNVQFLYCTRLFVLFAVPRMSPEWWEINITKRERQPSKFFAPFTFILFAETWAVPDVPSSQLDKEGPAVLRETGAGPQVSQPKRQILCRCTPLNFSSSQTAAAFRDWQGISHKLKII